MWCRATSRNSLFTLWISSSNWMSVLDVDAQAWVCYDEVVVTLAHRTKQFYFECLTGVARPSVKNCRCLMEFIRIDLFVSVALSHILAVTLPFCHTLHGITCCDAWNVKPLQPTTWATIQFDCWIKWRHAIFFFFIISVNSTFCSLV